MDTKEFVERAPIAIKQNRTRDAAKQLRTDLQNRAKTGVRRRLKR